jgi:hypothetical protein
VVVAACLGVGAFGLSHVDNAFGPRRYDGAADLEAHTGTSFASVACDTSTEVGLRGSPRMGKTYSVFECDVGGRTILVLAPLSIAELPARVEGELRPTHRWDEAELPVTTSPRSFLHLELEVGDNSFDIGYTIFGLLSTLGGLGIVAWWLRDRRRASRTAQAG